MLKIQTLRVGELATNCYFVTDPITHETLVVDPADAPEYISDVLERESLTPIGIVATHGHFDHILGVFGLEVMYNIPFYLHPDDLFLVRRMQESARHFLKRNNIDPAPRITNNLAEGAVIEIGKESVRILHTPGHTPGSVVIHIPAASASLVGDSLFADGSVGRTDTSYGDSKGLTHAIARIVQTPGVKMLYAGHGEPLSIDRAKVMFSV